MADDKTISLPVEKPGTITLTTSQYDAIMGRLEKVEGSAKRPQRVKEHTATLRIHEGKPVVRYGKTVNYTDKVTGERKLKLDVFVVDSDKPASVDYLDFLNDKNQVLVKIVSQKAQEHVEVQGTMRAENPDQARISKSWSDPGQIDLEVTSVEYEVDIEILDGELAGQKLTVPAAALNA